MKKEDFVSYWEMNFGRDWKPRWKMLFEVSYD